jgi:hypothetical protein
MARKFEGQWGHAESPCTGSAMMGGSDLSCVVAIDERF